jgi:hypothetical protein
MRKLRSLRRLIALATLVGWALLQVAATAQACPLDAAGPVAPLSAAADPMGMADEAPPCGEHCATQHSVGSSALPGPMPALSLAPAMRVAAASVDAEVFHAARQHSERRITRGDAVSLLVRLRVFRE